MSAPSKTVPKLCPSFSPFPGSTGVPPNVTQSDDGRGQSTYPAKFHLDLFSRFATNHVFLIWGHCPSFSVSPGLPYQTQFVFGQGQPGCQISFRSVLQFSYCRRSNFIWRIAPPLPLTPWGPPLNTICLGSRATSLQNFISIHAVDFLQ